MGKKHPAGVARVFVSFPETGEIELPQITNVELGGDISAGWEITLTFLASAEVQYIEDELLKNDNPPGRGLR
jgi:hypothetical protein